MAKIVYRQPPCHLEQKEKTTTMADTRDSETN
jgi:hypothetical protein